MIYSRKLLERFLPLLKDVNDEELSKAIGSTGNELPLKDIFHHPRLNNVVIGRILSFEKHPNSDHLNVCQVQIDQAGKTHTIVCGASNVTKDKNVIVALEGAKLHDGRIIEYKEVRGIVSQGMLCGYYELTPLNSKNISLEDSLGILLFDDGVIGDTNVEEFLGFDDTIYEIEVPFANRNDINGVLNFCQDLAGYFKWKFVYPNPDFSKADLSLDGSIEYDKKLCNGFALAHIDNVQVKASAWKDKKLLMNNGMKPLNNILDKLNYITLLTNVPTAAYDINDNININVTSAKNGESFTGFDNKTYELNKNDIVVKNNNEIICLAGILGDKKHGINNDTKKLYIEMANFNFVNIRNTSSKYNIKTDSARRNSKLNNNFLVLTAASLLQTMFANNNLKYSLNIKEQPVKTIKFNAKKINELLGTNFTKTEIISHLELLGFNIEDNKIIPPAYRNDVSTNPDLAEEVIKTIDVNDIEAQPIDTSGMTENKYTEYYFINRFWNILTNNFIYEAKTYNTTNKNNLNKFNVFDYSDNVEIISANNINRQFLRNNTIDSLLRIYKYNSQYKNKLVPLFETQKIYQENKPGIKNLTIITPEIINLDNVNKSNIVYNVNGLKAIINQITKTLNATVEYKIANNKHFYDNECISINYKGNVIGYIGCIKKTLLNEYNVNEKIYCASINWENLYNDFKEPSTNICKAISNLMPIIKDITFVYADKPFEPAINAANKLEFINEIIYLDKFEKDGIISYTIRFIMKNSDNLTKDAINENINKIISEFANHDISIKK